ncbi:MAG TPA: amylo-alpha-1,6-glucosidase [Thermoanaerobaculia bacterium]|nr:amylo-alpha-1,6-glucosidase [Thermoanaerobaculia bacterium]
MTAIISLPREECLRLHESLRREWLETNGRGGFASSTVLLCPTRRYHGLLLAALPGNPKRHSFLARFEEDIRGGERDFPLSMARYPGLWAPQGHQGIMELALVPYPSWRYQIGRVEVRREILMAHGEPVVLCRYVARHPLSQLEIRLRPLLTCREADALTFENLMLDHRIERIPGGIRTRPYPSLPALVITIGGVDGRFEADPVWYRRIEYQRDLIRGYDGHEDQWSPGWFDLPLHTEREIVVAASLSAAVEDPVALWHRESEARRRVASRLAAEVSDGLEAMLHLGADDFLFRDPEGRLGVIAGFPWFGEWGRDTFVSLPGLTLCRGRVEDCGEALEGALRFLSDGRLPNVVGPDQRTSVYGSLDTPLWFAWAVEAYDDAGGDRRRVEEVLLPAIEQIASALLDGRRPGAICDEVGLVGSRPGTESLTWMDSRVDGRPVTPRRGAPVEVNALWYSLLRFLERKHRARGSEREARRWGAVRRRVGAAFLERFWLAEPGRLADAWNEGVADPAVRPNMVIAAALASSPLDRAQRLAIVETAERELLTPLGLRTLSPSSPDYAGRYSGGPRERDRAYHQGTVWPWLLGFYVEACLRARGRRAAEVSRLREQLHSFEQQHRIHGLLHISEVYDGDPPHRPGGAVAQAWSAAELIRAFVLLDARSGAHYPRGPGRRARSLGPWADPESAPMLEARPREGDPE